MLRLDQARENDLDEQARMFERSGFVDHENPLARFEQEIADLERRIADQQSASGRLPGLAIRGSQQEASIVNAARNQNDERHREAQATARAQLRALEELVRTMRAALSNAATLN
jgi:hypothetical protein